MTQTKKQKNQTWFGTFGAQTRGKMDSSTELRGHRQYRPKGFLGKPTEPSSQAQQYELFQYRKGPFVKIWTVWDIREVKKWNRERLLPLSRKEGKT